MTDEDFRTRIEYRDAPESELPICPFTEWSIYGTEKKCYFLNVTPEICTLCTLGTLSDALSSILLEGKE